MPSKMHGGPATQARPKTQQTKMPVVSNRPNTSHGSKESSLGSSLSAPQLNGHESQGTQMSLTNDSVLSSTTMNSSRFRKSSRSTSRIGSDDSVLQSLQRDTELYAKRIEDNKKVLAHTERQIAETVQAIAESKKRIGGVQAVSQNENFVKHQTTVLQKRWEVALQRETEAKAKNSQLKEKINDIRLKKIRVKSITADMESELRQITAQKEYLSNKLIEINTKREETIQKTEDLQLHADEMSEKYEAEWKMLDADMDASSVLERIEANKNVLGSMTKEEEMREKTAIIQGTWDVTLKSMQAQKATANVKTYKQAFEAIKEATGVRDLDHLVERFTSIEDENFRLFSHVNELQEEEKRLQVEYERMNKELGSIQQKWQEEESSKNRILQNIQDQIDSVDSQSDQYREQYKEIFAIARDYKDVVQTLFVAVDGQNYTHLDDMFATKDESDYGISEFNMMEFLGIVEQRVNEIYQIHFAAQHPHADGEHDERSGGKIHKKKPTTVLNLANGSSNLPSSEKTTFFGGPNAPADFNAKDKYNNLSNKVMNVKDVMSKVFNIEEGGFDDDFDQPVSIKDLKAQLAGGVGVGSHIGSAGADNTVGNNRLSLSSNGSHGPHGLQHVTNHAGHAVTPFKQHLKPLARPSPS